jgi:hypothetical protein
VTERMTAAEYAAQKAPSDNKRVKNATKTEVDGIRFDSKREANRWKVLKVREKAGEITCLKRQVPLILCGKLGPILTPTGKPMVYKADFEYIDWTLNGVKVIEDAKGYPTEVYQIKKAILAAQDVTVNEV